MPQSQELATVEFQGQPLTTVKINDQVYVGLKQIADALGLDWRGQHAKLQTDQRYGAISMPLPSEGGEQQSICIPLTKLNGWLFGVNPNKVKPEHRARLIEYQEKCFTALWAYWHEGGAHQQPELPQPKIQDLRFYPFDHHGRHWVARLQVRLHLALQPLVALLGLDWSRWEPIFERNHARFGVVGLSGHFPGAGGTPLAVPLNSLPEVLTELGKEVAPDRQPLLQIFQAELADTLQINWQTRHPLTRESLLQDEPLSQPQQEAIKTAVRARLVGSEFKQAGILYLYGRLKRRFGVEKWTDIRRGDFEAAMELVATDDGRELLRTTPKLALPDAVIAPQTAVKRLR